LSRKERKAPVRSIRGDVAGGYDGMGVEPFPFCIVGEECRCAMVVPYSEEKTASRSKTVNDWGKARQHAHPLGRKKPKESVVKINYPAHELVILQVPLKVSIIEPISGKSSQARAVRIEPKSVMELGHKSEKGGSATNTHSIVKSWQPDGQLGLPCRRWLGCIHIPVDRVKWYYGRTSSGM
jgi:hypothetical protein